MVTGYGITRLENIEFITCNLQPLMINSIFLLVIIITTRKNFQYFLTAIKDSLNHPDLNFSLIGWQIIPMLLVGELCPVRLKSLTSGITITCVAIMVSH